MLFQVLILGKTRRRKLKKWSEYLANHSLDTTGGNEMLSPSGAEDASELEELETQLEAIRPEDLINLDSREALRSNLLQAFKEHFRTDR